jgi:deazaflavin-dependent oxidoreductase (nitroreductase family)
MLSMTAMHRGLLRLTGGRIGSRLGSMPVIELTTSGRRSGEMRRALLTVATREGEALVVVASRGGDDEHPAWYLNLLANPDVLVGEPGAEPQPMHSRVATADERGQLWPRVVRAYSGYAAYQRKTDRQIPLVILEPVSGSESSTT